MDYYFTSLKSLKFPTKSSSPMCLHEVNEHAIKWHNSKSTPTGCSKNDILNIIFKIKR